MKTHYKLVLLTLLSCDLALAEPATVEAELSTQDVGKLNIHSHGIGIRLRPSESDSIRVVLRVEIADKSSAEVMDFIDSRIEFSLDKVGSEAVLKSRVLYPTVASQFGRLFQRRNEYEIAEISVELPANIALHVLGDAANIDITGIHNNVSINHGEGSLTMSDVVGTSNIIVGSGLVNIQNLQGNLAMDLGGGSLSIAGIEGGVKVGDGSGALAISDVSGDLLINDVSGGVQVSDVGGALSLYTDGRGEVFFEGVEGEARIKAKRAGPISLSSMRGATHIIDSRGEIETTIPAGENTVLNE